MERSLEELAAAVGAELRGDGSVKIRGVAPIDRAEPGTISFITDRRLRKWRDTTCASAVVVPPDLASGRPKKPLLVTPNPHLIYARVATIFAPTPALDRSVSKEAIVDQTARIGREVSIGPWVTVGPRVRIGDRSAIGPNVFIGEDVSIGEDCLIRPHVVILPGSILGNRVLLHPGVVIGADGFGFAYDGERPVKIPQLGRVRIEDDVEIGANSCIDRAAMGETVIRKCVKIDNLVQVAHNVEVGENTVLAAQTGVSGSSKLGRGVMLGGQVGVTSHIVVGDGVRAVAKTGIHTDVEPGMTIGGYPYLPRIRWGRAYKVLERLPEIRRVVQRLEKRVAELEVALARRVKKRAAKK